MSFIAKNNTALFEAFGDNLTMICERKKRQTVLLYITYFMEDVKPRSAQWSRLVICKSKFLLGVGWGRGQNLGPTKVWEVHNVFI